MLSPRQWHSHPCVQGNPSLPRLSCAKRLVPGCTCGRYYGNLSWGKEAKLQSLEWYLRHFPCIFITKGHSRNKCKSSNAHNNCIYYPITNKNNNYTAKAVLEREEGKAKTWCLPAEAIKASPQLSRRGPLGAPMAPLGVTSTERHVSAEPHWPWAPPERRPWVLYSPESRGWMKKWIYSLWWGRGLGEQCPGKITGKSEIATESVKKYKSTYIKK